ncbi:hypothetical protein ACMGD3_24125 [Lysinibacillus sphaericus]|uniref:hypothetical protein n=1 Tax=Lysinibacillus sphaericus TaxID=1421 RepID=UPI003F7A48E3
MNEKQLLLPCIMNQDPLLPRVLTFQEEMELRLKEWKRVANIGHVPSGKIHLARIALVDEFYLQFNQSI